jgi:hypothetical protein
MQQKRRMMPSDVLIVLAVPGLLMGLVTLFASKTEPNLTMDYVLWDLLRFAGYVGLGFVALSIVAAVVEHLIKSRS